MSSSTEGIATQIAEATQNAIAERGGMVESQVGLVIYLDGDGERCYARIVGDGQGMATSLGLVEILSMMCSQQVADAFLDAEGED